MRLGLLIYGNLNTLSGGYLYDRKLVAYLKSQGDQVEIISLPWRSYARCLGDNLSRNLGIRLKRLEVDFLLQDELNHPSLFWLNRRLRGRISYPILTIVHHLRASEHRPAWQNRLYGWVESRYLSSVDGFIFNSQTTRQAVAQAGVNLNTRSGVVAHPAGDRLDPQITEQALIQRAYQPGPLKIVFVGNLIPRKGLHTLLQAISQLPPGDCQLNVIGRVDADPAYYRKTLTQIAKQELSTRVKLSGALTDSQLYAQLMDSHLLVVPSTYEGFGIVYLEGMGFGLPAIGTDRGAAAEIITPGVDGYLVPAENPSIIAEYIAALAHDRQKLLSLSLAARRRYLNHPTWEMTGEKIRQFLFKFHHS